LSEAAGGGRRPGIMMALQNLAEIERLVWPRGFTSDLWMIVDAARDPRVYPLLVSSYLEYSCLYSGVLPPAIERAAPYLVQLVFEGSYTRRLLESAWGNSWGVILRCDASLSTVRRHLRQFLMVRDPRGQQVLFRYYDPRVLRTYLPTCTEDELERFFGPIESFWIEGKESQNILGLRLDNGKLVQRTYSLTTPSRNPEPEISEVPRTRGRARGGPLTIRAPQVSAFSQAAIQRFEDWMILHLRQFFPQQCDSLREAQLRELVAYGRERAARHKITSERDVSKFIDLMLVFGRDFDVDKRIPWAGRILANRKTARSKMRSLFEAAKTHLARP
jgi:Domain of unknown function (DUF4123)